MRAVIQRVDKANVSVNNEVVGRIGKGLVVLIAVENNDSEKDLEFMKRKIIGLRVFNDEEGRINLSVLDVSGEILLISQFTLYGDCRKGNRPSFTRSAVPELAERTYLRLAESLRGEGIRVDTGKFQAMMKVSLINDGPVTVIVDSKKEFY
jgi:D-tyrosyl-tRNA(Tyr) deacylase